MQNRKATYEVYPSKNQIDKLLMQLELHQQLWNGALEERIDAWRKHTKSISYEDQCKSLTIIRNDDELKALWTSVNCSSQQVTLNRLHKAFNAFFNRVKKGQTPGFPRFKSKRRMTSLGFKSHGDGWSFKPTLKNNGKPDDYGNISWGKHGVLYLQGIGHLKVRGQTRAAGVVKSCEVFCQNDRWFVSLTLACADVDIQRQRTQHHIVAADWGVADLLTLVETSHPLTQVPDVPFEHVRFNTIANPRWYKTSEAKSRTLAQNVSRKIKFSKCWHKAQHIRAKFEAKRARKRHDGQHKLSAHIASKCLQFATEKLDVKAMTSNDNNNNNIFYKNTLHREVLDTAPGALFNKIAYKVSETGGQYLTAPTKVIKPSQTCPPCGHQHKKTLSERQHDCKECGFKAGRDEAAALVVLYWSMGILPPIKKEKKNKKGQEPDISLNSCKTILSNSALKSRNHHQVQSFELGGV